MGTLTILALWFDSHNAYFLLCIFYDVRNIISLRSPSSFKFLNGNLTHA
jgi:hypothetical protein